MKTRSIYLVAHYAIRPKTKYIANTAGWMKNPDNVSYDEQMTVTVKLAKKDQESAKVILDLTNRTVYRNSWRSESTFDDLFEYFYNGYPKYLEPVIQQLGYEMVSKDAVTTDAVVLPAGNTISSG